MNYSLGIYNTEVIKAKLKTGLGFIPEDSVLIIDQKLPGLYPELASCDQPKYFFNASESGKELRQAELIYSWLHEQKFKRDQTITAIGGGITTDLAGWVAANYMRGCKLINIPTTLVGMIDASIGGKTAINFQQTKNLIGSFYPAEKVIIIPEMLDTLPEKELNAGLAELVKMALLPDSKILELLVRLKTKWKNELNDLILLAIDEKLNICKLDLNDRGRRRILNLGHTFAHVIEAVSGYSIEHGRAVAVGMIKAAKLSYEQELINEKRYRSITELLQGIFDDDYLKLDDDILSVIPEKGQRYYENDKKSKLILFAEEDDIIITDTIEWNKFVMTLIK